MLNLGIFPGWELVVDGQNFVGFDVPFNQAKDRLLDTDVLAKAVFLPGVLQGVVNRPSIAAEAGPLLPNVNGESGVGASLDVIVSAAGTASRCMEIAGSSSLEGTSAPTGSKA